jgi:hypothetical protein
MSYLYQEIPRRSSAAIIGVVDAIQITPQQLAGKPKRIGSWKGKDVFEAVTKGGYHLVMGMVGKALETLGVGPHRAIARQIARKNADGMQIDELSKSESAPPETYAHLLPKYEAVTDRLRALGGR